MSSDLKKLSDKELIELFKEKDLTDRDFPQEEQDIQKEVHARGGAVLEEWAKEKYPDVSEERRAELIQWDKDFLAQEKKWDKANEEFVKRIEEEGPPPTGLIMDDNKGGSQASQTDEQAWQESYDKTVEEWDAAGEGQNYEDRSQWGTGFTPNTDSIDHERFKSHFTAAAGSETQKLTNTFQAVTRQGLDSTPELDAEYDATVGEMDRDFEDTVAEMDAEFGAFKL
ncbi:MAG: hypothetical protein AAF204_00985 [Pseudomonadota bacterium]